MKELKKIDLDKNLWQDERGWGFNPCDIKGLNKEAIGDIHIVSINPNTIRGNHYHTNCTEWIFVLTGSVKVFWKVQAEEDKKELLIEEDKPVLLEVPPGIEHAFLNHSDKTVYLAVFSNEQVRDTIKTDLIENNQL